MTTPVQTPTDLPGLTLSALTEQDAEEYHALLTTNRDHLTRHGDYLDETAKPLTAVRADLTEPSDLRFGIRLDGTLIGRIDLVPVDPPRYSLGYWLAEDATGHGYATSAGRAILDLAARLGASDVYAGVTLGNTKSMAALERMGLTAVVEFDTYTRYHTAID
jgi:RimJ/RimL family protein N-acetyltransferase